jgi:hypothetical protein
MLFILKLIMEAIKAIISTVLIAAIALLTTTVIVGVQANEKALSLFERKNGLTTQQARGIASGELNTCTQHVLSEKWDCEHSFTVEEGTAVFITGLLGGKKENVNVGWVVPASKMTVAIWSDIGNKMEEAK